LLSSTGARDLQNPNNTQGISLNDLRPGDLLVKANDRAGVRTSYTAYNKCNKQSIKCNSG